MKKLGLLLLLVALGAQAAIYRIISTDQYVNGIPPGLTAAQKTKWLDSVNITETDKAVAAGKYLPTTTANAAKKVKELDKPVVPPVVVPPVVVPPVVTPPVVTPPVVVPPVVEPVPVPSSFLPKSAKHCGWEGQKCTIPAGVNARVFFGIGNSWASKDNLTGAVSCSKSFIGDPGFTSSVNSPECYWVKSEEFLNVLDPKGLNLMPYVNTALTPKGSAGFSTPMIKAAPIPPYDKTGAFRIGCEYSHGNNDDPIVYPGVPNASHHHTFFGNTSINAYSTSAGILKEGNSTCAGGILNRSGYWMPSLINTSTGAPQKPTFVVVYYKAIDEKSGSGPAAYQKVPPVGLRMIAGNARPLSVSQAEGGFVCQDQTRVNDDQNGYIWSGNNIKASCGGSQQMLRMIVTFPQCWDGKNLDSPDHKSHMAYACGNNCKDATGRIAPSANSCPASHPVAIPNITVNADFFNLDQTAKYRLASDNYSGSYPGGYSLHADWMNGWDEKTIERVVKNCLNNPKNCGGPNLGDGEKLYGVNED